MIQIISRRDTPRHHLIDTTSGARQGGSDAPSWSRGLSPFFLGPCALYGRYTARVMENAWQGAKVPHQWVDDTGAPTHEYFEWAERLWSNPRASRFPMGRGHKPAFSWWDGQALGYLDARRQIYFPLYRDALIRSRAYPLLLREYETRGQLSLSDFDGYDHDAMGLSLRDVLNNDRRPMGHAFVIKAVLLHGPDVTPDQL